MSVHLFGIRHHGPGGARALRTALDRLAPDCVLVEGPPDAQSALPLLMSEGMTPPVALLIYVPETPSRAVYYPFTHFSPEWQALRYALGHDIPARFFDLPQSIQFAREPKPEEPSTETPVDAETETQANSARSRRSIASVAVEEVVKSEDPLAMLAHAAGYDDSELWWEQQIEQRQDSEQLFDGILEAMTELRAGRPPRREGEDLREAHMRTMIRAAEKEGFQRIAVVCGAWHAPALVDRSDVKGDAALLKGLPQVKTTATWIPWTNSRLSYRSGYGAGVTSPGWYEHLWTTNDRLTIRWQARAAQVLREKGMDVSSASVIEAVRLAEALAAMRGLPMPGLAEQHEATQTVLCHGNDTPMALIREQLEIGERIGEVPPETPAVPLQRDLEATQKRLRFPPTTEIKPAELDLRKETDLGRSHLLHRMRLLGIEWGKPMRVPSNRQGTFWEHWQVQWQVEFAVAIIEANMFGNTVEVAATSFAHKKADDAPDLPSLTELLDRVILAGLPDAVDHLLIRVQTQAAVSADVRHLMDALPPLARVARYSDVRGTKAEHIIPVITSLFERVVIGLPGACSSLDDDAAAEMAGSIDHVQESIDLIDDPARRDEWHETLRGLMHKESIHGLVRGRCCRLLLEKRAIDGEELQKLASHALSLVNPAPQAAAWVEGVLRGSGLLLIHEDGLWNALDLWLRDLDSESFIALLPLLRRAFSGFQPPERRQMGEKVKHLSGTMTVSTPSIMNDDRQLDHDRAAIVLPILAQILGKSDA